MIVGVLAATFTFIFLIISLTSYYLFYKSNQSNLLNIARISFYFASALIFLQTVMLMWGIHTHQFHWQYVFSYSSVDLDAFYLTSTFWAGQEGTFLLWLVFGSIYGFFIIRSKNKDESLIMSFMGLVQAFIAMILIKKNPFTYIWDTFPLQFQFGELPLNGNGLNPLLQDPWMIIHPPVLFIGYSSTMILFSFAVSALIKKNYDEWIEKVLPYGLFVTMILGTGIIMGGYWAYTTLGWGGYWAWDPVENSSLIPWLTSIVFIHGIMIQRKHGGLKRTNIFIALLTFILVLWGSFLTRSGILADFSVHSFSETVINNYLIGFVAFFAAIAFLIFLFKSPKVKSNHVNSALFTRESFMLFGILTILISAVFTFFGTSSPLFTKLIFGESSNVSLEYYNLLNTPVIILVGIFIAIAPILRWKKESAEKLKGIYFHIIAAIIISILAFSFGLRQVIPLIIFAVFNLAILINGEIVFNHIKRKNWGFGGFLAHLGFGLMIVGIVISSVYDVNKKALLSVGEEKNVLGYQLKYTGMKKNAEGKEEAIINILSGNSQFQAAPNFYWSDYNRGYMRNPSVHNLWLKDLYISPIQVIPAGQNTQGSELTLFKNKPVYFEDYLIEFKGYEIDRQDMSEPSIYIPAILSINYNGQQIIINPAIRIENNTKEVLPAKLPMVDREISIKEINVNDNSLKINITDKNDGKHNTNKEMLAIEVTEKPLINLLWLGTFLLIGGMIISIINRVKINKY